MRTLEDTTFLLLVIAISLAFAWIVWPLYGAVLLASVMAIVFAPLHRKLSRLIGPRRNLAALANCVSTRSHRPGRHSQPTQTA